MNCINTNTNEFKELKRATKLSTFELENVIYLYQSQNGTDEFPSIEYITSRTSDIMRTELNRTNDMIDQQQQMLEEHAVDVNYINTISDDLDTSIHIENHIREKVLIEAKEKGVKVKFANLANVTDKVLVINGEYVVNLSAIHQDDKLDTLLKPLQALTPEVIDLAKNDINANNRKVITTKIKVLDNDSINTVQTSDIVGSVIYRSSKGELMLTPNDGEALAIISNPDLTERQKRNRLDKISVRIFDSNMDSVSDSLLENKPFHIISKPNIETEYSDTMKALNVVTLALEQNRKGVFNLEKSESKAELLEAIKQSTKDIKNDDKTFINSVEVSDKVTIQTLGPFEFKTEADMNNFLDDLTKIDDEMSDLITKFRNDTISKRERSVLNHYLRQIYLDSRDQLLRDTAFNNRFTNDLFEKTRLFKRYEAIRSKLKNNIRPNINNRTSKTVSTKTIGSNTIIQSIIGEALKNTMNDATINIGERIDNVLDKLQLALLEKDEEAIENLKYELGKLTSEMKAYTGKGYNPTGDYSKALMKIFNNIQNTTLSQRAVNTQSRLEYTPAQQAELAVLEVNIERAQKTFNENVDKGFDTFKNSLKDNSSLTSELNVDIKNQFSDLINEGKTSIKDLNEAFSNASPELKRLFSKNKLAFRKYFQEYIKESNDLNRVLEESENQREFIESKAIVISDNLNSTDDGDHVDLYKIPNRHKVAKNNINKNVQADAKIMETRYNEDYSQLYGNLRDNKNYAVRKENESDLQYKLNAISKALNANIILDENFEGRAALLSDNSYQVRRARENGDSRPVIIMNPNFLLSDTVFHEFGHLYIELLGNDDKLVKEAIYLLAGTKLHERVAKEYPELNGIELDKEVLATALGIEADMIFARSIEKLVWWQNILRGIMDFLKRTFNIDQDALQKLASEMLSIRKTRVESAEGYSSNITYYSKYQVDKEKKAQLEAKRIFEELRANVTIDEETHKYSENGDELFQSITTIAGRMAGKKKVASDKGDFSMEFDKNLLDKDLIFNLLNSPRVPAPLAHALNDLINSRIQGVIPTADVKVGDNWHTVYLRENTNTIATELNIAEEALRKELLKNNPHLRKSLRQDIIDNFDAIMNRAEELNKRYKSASVMGNILHKAVENFIKDEAKNGRPINIENSREYFDMIQDIYDKGIAAGSMFFSEQVLYDEDTRSPGTADLVEITADGKFKIYDFKSVKSFKDKEGSDLNPYQLYYGKGYVHQLLSYGEILKKYGLEPHDDPYHILIAEVQPTEDGAIIESENESISLGNSKSVSIKNLKGFESRYKKSQTDVTRYFKNKKVSRIDLKSEIENLEDATDKIYQVIKKFDKVLKSKTKDLDTANNFNSLKAMMDTLADTDAMKEHAEQVKYEYNRYISKQNTVVISKFLDSVHAVMGELRDTYSDGLAETSSRQIQALNYVLQVAESLYDIKKGLTPQELRKTNAFTEAEAIEIERKIDETIAAIKDNREFYSKKTIENAIHILASNDLEQMGFMVEQLEIEARKQGKRSKEEIAKYVQEHIKDKKDLLESQNLAAWTARFENGLLDIRTLEYLFADPGMINSQIVQIAKQMMNANDMFVRNVMMELGPMIENWYNNSSKGTGNTRQTWGKFLNKSSVYIPQTGKYETIEDGTLMPEFVSDKYYDKIEFENKMRNLNREKKYLLQKEGLNKETTEKLDKINEQIEKIKEEYNQKTSKMKPADLKKYLEKRVNPDFKRLSTKEQEDLRFIHTQLREADDRIDNRAKRLSSYVGNDVIIYTLPKKRMDVHEAGISGFAATFKSKIEDLRRPPADEDTENITEDEMNPAESGTVITDVKGSQHLDIPVFYRNELEDPRLQSFDIPTLLLENHQTSLTYQQGTEMEADLFILKESVNKENNDKILKTDNLINKQLNDVSNRFTQKSENNNLHKAISSAIDQHLYKRGYSGTYTRGNYKVIKWAEAATRFGTINGLVGNFKSGITTSLQGSVYRTIEGIAGEHFNMDDWKKGTLKTYQDIGEVIKDTQRHVHKSKSNLLARYFGLEQRATALANKFVQDNFASKNLDSDTLYAVTSIAETMVTQMLMYSMLSNIKVMDKNQNYLDKDGNIVTDIKDAMSLDEAYTVEDGKLKLNPKVVYTTKNFVDKYAENGKVDFDVATRISSYMQNVYANMYGQYNENMKSAVQRTAAGKMVMSMKGWLARGMHNRFRGITSAIPFMESRLSFEDLRKSENIDKRFFSQASGTFHEGYHSTMIRYVADVYKEMGGKMNKLAFSSVYSNMTTHERANLKRSLIELALVLATFAMYKFVAAMAKLYDDEDEEASEYFYFTAYMTYRLHDEIATFINPFAMMDMLTNPAVALNNFASIGKLLSRLFGFEYSMEEGVDWSINDRYTKGDQKDNLKVTKDVLKITPGVNNALQFFGLLGFDTGRTMEDQFKNQMSANR